MPKDSSIEIMKPTTTSGLIAMSVDNPALEIDDFERFVESSTPPYVISTLRKA
jgi:hypothetical protein